MRHDPRDLKARSGREMRAFSMLGKPAAVSSQDSSTAQAPAGLVLAASSSRVGARLTLISIRGMRQK